MQTYAARGGFLRRFAQPAPRQTFEEIAKTEPAAGGVRLEVTTWGVNPLKEGVGLKEMLGAEATKADDLSQLTSC